MKYGQEQNVLMKFKGAAMIYKHCISTINPKVKTNNRICEDKHIFLSLILHFLSLVGAYGINIAHFHTYANDCPRV